MILSRFGPVEVNSSLEPLIRGKRKAMARAVAILGLLRVNPAGLGIDCSGIFD